MISPLFDKQGTEESRLSNSSPSPSSLVHGFFVFVFFSVYEKEIATTMTYRGPVLSDFHASRHLFLVMSV